MASIITRMPPSPTGHLHIGTARTALFNYLFAKSQNGKMIFRSEDTDKARSKKEFEDEIIEGLHWLGIEWDNEVVFRQSERTAIYRTYIEKMISSGTAYLSKEESKQTPGATVEVVRLKNPNKSITFTDLIRGEITFDTTELGDLVIARSIDDPLYHLTVVVDDFEMGVTHVLRGEDHISNTPRQILIQEAINAPRPIYGHLPLILAPDRSKMSKRHGAVAINEYRTEGFLADAIVNYLALLGWNPGTNQEIFTLDELISIFDIKNVQKSGAIFNREKFLWLNKEHLSRISDDEFSTAVSGVLPTNLQTSPYFSERFPKLLPNIRERINIYDEARIMAEAGEFDWVFTNDIQYDTHLLKWKNDENVQAALPRLTQLRALLTNEVDFASPEAIKTTIWPYAEEVGKGEVLWPLRVALTGRERSPDPFNCCYILGQEETTRRIQIACDKINQ